VSLKWLNFGIGLPGDAEADRQKLQAAFERIARRQNTSRAGAQLHRVSAGEPGEVARNGDQAGVVIRSGYARIRHAVAPSSSVVLRPPVLPFDACPSGANRRAWIFPVDILGHFMRTPLAVLDRSDHVPFHGQPADEAFWCGTTVAHLHHIAPFHLFVFTP